MNQLILVQGNMHPVPNDIEVLLRLRFPFRSLEELNQSPEEAMQNTFRGNAMLLSGKPEAFINWLKPFNGIWICSNPLIGDWEVVHIKKELQ